jgi:hypothetical protein
VLKKYLGSECWQTERVTQMGKVLSFNNVRKARGGTRTGPDMAGQCPEEIRAKLNPWVAELTAVIANLEKMLGALNAEIAFLPASQGKVGLEDLRAEILVQIYASRRFLAEVSRELSMEPPEAE